MHRNSDSSDFGSFVSAKPRNRQVSSRFMTPSMASKGSLEPGFSSRTETTSPVQRKTGFTSSSLANYIGDRLRDREHNHHDREKAITKTPPSSVFSHKRQRSCKELKNNKNNDNGSSKENDRPVIVAGSLKHTGRFTIPGKSISSSSTMNGSSSHAVKKQSSNNSCISLERLSLDENAMYKKSLSSSRRNHLSSDSVTTSIESEPGSFNSPTRTITSSRKLGREVSSKYMTMSDNNALAKRAPTRWTSDSDIISNPTSLDELMMSTMNKKFNPQKGASSSIKRTNSLIGYKSSMSQWALSPGRSESPTMSVESKERPLSFSSLRPHNKSVEKILSTDSHLFRTTKSSSQSKSSSGFGNSEDVHALRLLDNKLLQWRFANARAQVVNHNVSHQAESNLACALDTITKLRHSVMQKKIQLEKEKLKMKLNFVLHSQMKLLETWGCMERQHLPIIAVMTECLQSAVCKVPLLKGAKVDIESTSDAQKYAYDLTSSINKLLLTSFSPLASKTAELLSELAEVVAQEKLLLQEFYDLFQTISLLQFKERSLKCSLIQLQC